MNVVDILISCMIVNLVGIPTLGRICGQKLNISH